MMQWGKFMPGQAGSGAGVRKVNATWQAARKSSAVNAVSSACSGEEAPRAAPSRAHRFESIDNGSTERSGRMSLCQSRERAVADAIRPTVEISPSDIVRRQSVVGDGLTVESVECLSQQVGNYRFRAPIHLLVAYARGTCRKGETFVGSMPPSMRQSFSRKLTFVPAGQEYRAWHEPRTRPHFIYFYFDPAMIEVNPTSGNGDVPLAPRLFFENATLWHTIIKIKNLVEARAPVDRSYFEALGTVLAYELRTLNQGAHGIDHEIRGGLAGWQQRIVTAYIEEKVAERIRLVELAQLVRLSPHHFCRSFGRSFGTPPHRYQINRRIEWAKWLLEKPIISITDVALKMGFGSPNAFATAFRQTTGLTPTAYRRKFASAEKFVDVGFDRTS